MKVLGTTKILMTTRTRTVPTEAIVTTNLAHPVLLSWHDLIRLKVIDENFPLSANIVVINTRLEILDAYPTVFQDSLDSNPMPVSYTHLTLPTNREV